MSAKTHIHCDQCRHPHQRKDGTLIEVSRLKDGGPKLPRGWKRHKDQVWCKSCWQESHVLRAVTIPVYQADWETLRPALKSAFAAATTLSNQATRVLMANDVRRDGQENLPPMPPVYLYGELKDSHVWEDIDKASASALLQAVEQKYRSRRYSLLWTCDSSPPHYRHPQPYPMRPDAIKLSESDQEGRIEASILVAGSRHTVTLAGGHQFRRQLLGVRHLIDNPALMGQAALYEVEVNDNHRATGKRSVNGNGPAYRTRLLLKLAGWFPRASRKRSGEMRVHTDPESLLVAVDANGDRVWRYHADHAKQIATRHVMTLGREQRLRDDNKAERRKPRRSGKKFRAKMSALAKRDQNRLTSLCHEVSASVVAFANRRGYFSISYLDSDHKFCESFPWAKLRTMIDQKARAAGLTFEHSSGPVPEKTPAALESEEGQ